MSILKNKKGSHPVAKMVLPKEVEKVGNGKLTDKMMKKVKCGGVMWSGAADAFNAMYDAALAAGHKLRNIGDYRPFDGQLSMFMDRYDQKATGRKPEITRTYQGKTWYLKKGKSPSGTPGTSNHGFGLAIDLAIDAKGKIANIGGTKAYDWMCENAPNYGFYLQGAPTKADGKANPEYEAWHWQYCIGDKPAPALSGAAPAVAPAPAPVAPAAPAAPAPQKAADPSNDVVLAVGSKGPEVVELQKLLAKKKFYSGKADGDFGKVTEAAVNKFKSAKGLKADGRVGAKTFALLRLK
jgi:D-alanyl-D-alanine dipeptidase